MLNPEELREAAAPLAIVRILLGVRPENRARVLEQVREFISPAAPSAAPIERVVPRSHPAVRNGESPTMMGWRDQLS